MMPSAAFLRRLRERCDSSGEASGVPLDPAGVIETRDGPGAVRIRSKAYGEVWIALDPCMVPELVAEEARHTSPRPVLLASDVARLRGKPEAAIRAVLEVARAFPGARVLQ